MASTRNALASCTVPSARAVMVNSTYNGYRFEVEAEGTSASAHFTNGSREDEIEVSCRSGRPVRSGGDS